MLKLISRFVVFSLTIGIFLYFLNQFELNSSDSLVFHKTVEIKKQAREIDTIIFGTSASRHGIDPLIFDSLMASAGFATHTFNFSINGLPTIGQQFHLEKLLEHDFPQLRTVIFELSYPISFIAPNDLHSPRYIEVHDTKRLIHYINYLWLQFGGKSRITTIADRIFLYIRNISLSGRAERLCESLINNQSVLSTATSAARPGRYTGFIPSELFGTAESGIREIVGPRKRVTEPEARKKFYHFLKKKTEIPEKIKTRNEDAVLLQIFREIIRACEGRGIQVVFYLPPKPYHYRSLVQAYNQENLGAPLINMNSPRDFPELFNIENWFDFSHVNKKGARTLTTKLSERLLELPEFSNTYQQKAQTNRTDKTVFPSRHYPEN